MLGVASLLRSLLLPLPPAGAPRCGPLPPAGALRHLRRLKCVDHLQRYRLNHLRRLRQKYYPKLLYHR
jgi:hypothetical protein